MKIARKLCDMMSCRVIPPLIDLQIPMGWLGFT